MTLHHWVSQLRPYRSGVFSYDLPAWRYRIEYIIHCAKRKTNRTKSESPKRRQTSLPSLLQFIASRPGA